MACPGRPAVSRPSPPPGNGRSCLGRFRILFVILPGLLAVSWGCDRPATGGPAAGIVVVDDAGDTLRLAAPATRIVSLVPATTELLFALGLGGEVVGRTAWCDFPAEAAAVPSLGDGLQPNLEAIVATRPGLVVLYNSTLNVAAAARLRAQGVPTVLLNTDRLADVPRLARLLATLGGRPGTGDSLAGAFERELREVSRPGSGAPPVVLVLAWDQPPIAIGAGSFLDEIVTRAGARNAFHDLAAASAPVSLEAIAARDLDYVLVLGDSVPGYAARPEWQSVPAVGARRFLFVPPPLFSRPGPRSPQAIVALRSALTAGAGR